MSVGATALVGFLGELRVPVPTFGFFSVPPLKFFEHLWTNSGFYFWNGVFVAPIAGWFGVATAGICWLVALFDLVAFLVIRVETTAHQQMLQLLNFTHLHLPHLHSHKEERAEEKAEEPVKMKKIAEEEEKEVGASDEKGEAQSGTHLAKPSPSAQPSPSSPPPSVQQFPIILPSSRSSQSAVPKESTDHPLSLEGVPSSPPPSTRSRQRQEEEAEEEEEEEEKHPGREEKVVRRTVVGGW